MVPEFSRQRGPLAGRGRYAPFALNAPPEVKSDYMPVRFLKRWLQKLAGLTPEYRRDVRICLLLAVITIILYAPGIDWGLPPADAPGRTRPWAPDELGPIGPIVELRNTFMGEELGNPQYPLFHYIFIAIFYAPYLAFKLLNKTLVHPHGGYPFGFSDPATAVPMLLLTARAVSVLMSAGTIVASYFTAKTLWDRATGVLTAIFVMMIYSMFYYGKISNVDVPALFWCSLVILLYVRTFRDGLPIGRAVWMGLFAALAVATKDGSYGVFFLFPLVMLPLHFRHLAQQGRTTPWNRWHAPLIGLFASAATYVVMSGLILRPEKYLRHIEFIRSGSTTGRFYFEYAPTLAGYWGLMRECLYHLRDSLGWPILIASVAGVALCLARREWLKLTLLLPIPTLFVFVFMPVRYVELRYVLPWAYVLGFFAACAVAAAWRFASRPVRALAAVAVISACGLGVAKGMDLAYVMYHDSRYVAAEWLAKNAKEGQQVVIFGPQLRLRSMPHLPKGVTSVSAKVTRKPNSGTIEGEFVMLMQREDLEDFWYCPRWVHDALLDGSLGYDLVRDFHTNSLSDIHTRQVFVNPHLLIFARRDIARQFHAGSPPGL